MIKNKNITLISFVLLFIVCVITIIITYNSDIFIEVQKESEPLYALKLFDDEKVHTIDIIITEDNWNKLIENAIDEEYYVCDAIIDNEQISEVGIRAKGNTSLSQIYSDDTTDRYSFKIKFDCYDSSLNYYGLDELALNNLISDNTYMKDYIVYDMMNYMGVAAPLSSFVNIKINGESWGLYLGVECLDNSFLMRNYGNDYGELYKPETMDNIKERPERDSKDFDKDIKSEGFLPDEKSKFSKQGNGADLKYTDDSFNSYSTIFDSAKTKVNDSDKIRLIKSLKMLSDGDIFEAVDIDAIARYFVVHNFVCNYDSYTGSLLHNYYLYEKDGLLTMLPWDYNLAFGGFGGGGNGGNRGFENFDNNGLDLFKEKEKINSKKEEELGMTSIVNIPIDNPLQGAENEDRPMWGKLIENDEFKKIYHELYEEFLNNYFNSQYFVVKMEKIYQLLYPYIENDVTAFCTIAQFEKGFETLKEFCLLRAESINGQLNGNISINDKMDTSNYVDASNLKSEDMGSQNRK